MSDPGTTWGLSVSFDNSQDRTFTNWYFENTGGLAKVLDPGTVPPLNVGEALPGQGDPVTARADESINIVPFGRGKINVGVYAELDEEKSRNSLGPMPTIRCATHGWASTKRRLATARTLRG